LGIYSQITLSQPQARTWILFYRSHYLAGNTKAIDALISAFTQRNIETVPIFLSSLREIEVQEELLTLFSHHPPDLILDTTSFSIQRPEDKQNHHFWQSLNKPIFQVILSSSSLEAYQQGYQGLSPRDVAMNSLYQKWMAKLSPALFPLNLSSPDIPTRNGNSYLSTPPPPG